MLSATYLNQYKGSYLVPRSPSIASEVPDPTNRVARVHGLLVAVEYLDLTKSENSSPLDVRSSNPSFLSPESRSKTNSWLAIRDVMDNMSVEWENLRAQVLFQMSEINQLYDECRNSKGLLEAGLFAFEKSITGAIPRDFCSIFALHSLSRALSHSLVEKNFLDGSRVLGGSEVWQSALQSSNPFQTRGNFKTASEIQWPKQVAPLPSVVVPTSDCSQAPWTTHYFNQANERSQEHLFPPLSNMDPVSSNGLSPSTPGSFMNAQPRLASATDFDHTSVAGLGIQQTQFPSSGLHRESKSVSNDFYPQDLIGITGNSVADPRVGSVAIQIPRNENVFLPILNGPSGSFDDAVFPAQGPNILFQSQSYPEADVQLSETPVSDEDLRETPLFLNILTFLDHLKPFLFELSVKGLTVKEPHEIMRRELINDIKDNLIKGLKPTKKCKKWSPHCEAVVSVATKLLDRGCFNGVDEVRQFIVWFGEIALETNSPEHEVLRKRIDCQVDSWKADLQLQRSRPPDEQATLSAPARQQGLSSSASIPGVLLNRLRKHRFSCKNCRKTFAKRGNLKRHEKNRNACDKLRSVAAHNNPGTPQPSNNMPSETRGTNSIVVLRCRGVEDGIRQLIKKA